MSPLHRLDFEEIHAGAPLPFDVFDKDGKALFSAGIVIASVGYIRLLLGRGLYREEKTTAPIPPGPRPRR